MVMQKESCTLRMHKAQFITPKPSLSTKNCQLSPNRIAKSESSKRQHVEAVKLKLIKSNHSDSIEVTTTPTLPASKEVSEIRRDLVSHKKVKQKNKRQSSTTSEIQQIENNELRLHEEEVADVPHNYSNKRISTRPVKSILKHQKCDINSFENKRKKKDPAISIMEEDMNNNCVLQSCAQTVKETSQQHLSDDDALSLGTPTDNDDDLLFL